MSEETKTAAATEATVEENTKGEKKASSKARAKRKPSPKAADLTLADLAEKYLAHMEREGKSNGTISSYGAELKLACKEIGAETKIADITTERVAAYFDCKAVTKLRSGRAKAKPSVDKSRRVLRLALVWAAERKWIGEAPIPEPTTKG